MASQNPRTVLLYLIRHGSTAFNEENRFRGKSLVPLSVKGVEQAQAVAKKLKQDGVIFDHMYCSPLPRAQETAKTIIEMSQPTGTTFEVNEALASIDYGLWEGEKESDIAQKYPQEYEKFQKSIHTFNFPNGGNLDKMKQEFQKFLQKAIFTKEAEEKTNDYKIGLVTHQVVTRNLICFFRGHNDAEKYWNIPQETACMNLIRIKVPENESVMVDPKAHVEIIYENFVAKL